MSSEQQEQVSWERLPGENGRWYGRFWRFVQAGTNRTLLGTVHAEEEEENRKAEQSGKKQKPLSKKVPGSWDKAAEQYHWRKRAADYDEVERKRVEAQKQAYIDSILLEGYALMHERIKALAAVAHQFEGYMRDEKRVWLADVKIVATGQGKAERVDLEVFNNELFKEYREYLDDIAEEVGGRVQKSDVNLSSQVVVREAPPGFFGEPESR